MRVFLVSSGLTSADVDRDAPLTTQRQPAMTAEEGTVATVSQQVQARGEEPSIPASRAKHVVVVLRGDALDQELVKLACNASRASKLTGSVLAIYGVEDPQTLQTDSHVDQEEEIAKAVIQQAQQVAERAEIYIQPEIVRTGKLAQRIIEEVNRQQCTLLIMGVPYQEKRNGTCPMDDTTEYVLQHAACRVWLIRGTQPTNDA
jgi:nucleotide-binding universal stress UspA family protein